MSENYLTEAFKEMKGLNEELFDFDKEGAEKLKKFMDGDDTDIFVTVIDPDVEKEEELEDSYEGKAILQCPICKSTMFKDPADVTVIEGEDLANIGEPCPMCHNDDGFEVVGEVCACAHESESDLAQDFVELTDEDTFFEDEEEEFNEGHEEFKFDGFEDEEDEEDDAELDIDESLNEDTVKTKSGKWVNKGEEGTHGTFKTKKAADAQRKAMFANGYKESMNEVFETVDEFKTWKFADKTKQGWEVKKLYKDLDDNRLHVVAYRPRLNDYVVGLGYSPDDGTWNQGRYDFASLDDAINSLKKDYSVTLFVKGDIDESLNEESNMAKLKRAYPELDFSKYSKEESLNEEACEDCIELTDSEYVFDEADGNIHADIKGEVGDYVKIHFVDDNDDKIYEYRILGTEGDDSYPTTLEYIGEADESLNEDFKKVDIETEDTKMSMTSEEGGKVTVTTEPTHHDDEECEECAKEEVEAAEEEAETIEPVSDEMKDEILADETTEDEGEEEEEVDIDEFDEESFDELGESYFKNVYDNVDSYKTSAAKINGNKLILEGIITFSSGKQAKTSFLFEASHKTARGKLKFVGDNKQITESKNSFIITATVDSKKLLTEALTYNYKVKGYKDRIYGTVRK